MNTDRFVEAGVPGPCWPRARRGMALLNAMMLLAITFRLLDAVKLFDTIFIMTNGGPGTNTYTSAFYLYTLGFTQFHLGEATAGAWIILVLTAIMITFLVRRLLREEIA